MFGHSKLPSDRHPYPRSRDSRRLEVQEVVGRYVFVVDLDEVIYVVPDGYHMHPRVLGNGARALYAGELYIDQPGHIEEMTNLSGTFRFKSQRSLCCVALHLRAIGFTVGEVIWYPPDGSSYPVALTCS